MKIFKVRIEYETVIRAESAAKAEEAADWIIRHESDDEPCFIAAKEVATPKDLPPGWHAQCRPWGERDEQDRTIAEMLSKP